MNKEQMKGSAKEAAGKVQQKAGEMTGSTEHELKGKAREESGKMEKKAGDAKEHIKDDSSHRNKH
ncbi:CsbD family protein [Piscinibacter sakaiensis]|uniref:CsbD family protein n=1 Tax=Piscinibacter sakaiensis TaxID=1547922 RepID=UPI003AAC66D2